MKIAFDTSVLVAGLVEAHPEFERASLWLDAADRGVVSAVWSTHAYAETWSVLTRLPLATRLSLEAVTAILESLVAVQPPQALLLTDYQAAAARCARFGSRSGAIFDALHLVAAERLGCDALLTLNVRDFHRLEPRVPTLAPPPQLLLPGAP